MSIRSSAIRTTASPASGRTSDCGSEDMARGSTAELADATGGVFPAAGLTATTRGPPGNNESSPRPRARRLSEVLSRDGLFSILFSAIDVIFLVGCDTDGVAGYRSIVSVVNLVRSAIQRFQRGALTTFRSSRCSEEGDGISLSRP